MIHNHITLSDGFAVTPSDSADLTKGGVVFITKAIALAAAGTIKVTMESGAEVTVALPAGIHYLRVRRVWATPAPPTTVAFA